MVGFKKWLSEMVGTGAIYDSSKGGADWQWAGAPESMITPRKHDKAFDNFRCVKSKKKMKEERLMETEIPEFDKITVQRLQHQAHTMPDSAMSVLWEEIWKVAQNKLGISLTHHLPKTQLDEIDELTITILNKIGISATHDTNTTGRSFIVKGQRVYLSNQRGVWVQD